MVRRGEGEATLRVRSFLNSTAVARRPGGTAPHHHCYESAFSYSGGVKFWLPTADFSTP